MDIEMNHTEALYLPESPVAPTAESAVCRGTSALSSLWVALAAKSPLLQDHPLLGMSHIWWWINSEVWSLGFPWICLRMSGLHCSWTSFSLCPDLLFPRLHRCWSQQRSFINILYVKSCLRVCSRDKERKGDGGCFVGILLNLLCGSGCHLLKWRLRENVFGKL